MALEPPLAFRRVGPPIPPSPLVIAVPHAGRHYPPSLLAESNVPRAVLEQLEDRHADRLIQLAVEQGAVAVIGCLARAWIDLNRAPEEVEEATRSPSARVRNGLGLIPTRLNGRPLWRHPLPATALDRRLEETHAPYHRAVADALAAARQAHGRALLVDCHSMPPLRGAQSPQIVIGDLHGRSAAREAVEAAVAAARQAGLRVARNIPYAGAYTLERHGAPDRRVDAMQIEIDRTLYLDGTLTTASAGLEPLADLFARLCWAAVAAQPGGLAEAAE